MYFYFIFPMRTITFTYQAYLIASIALERFLAVCR